jgi:hypothetical protein
VERTSEFSRLEDEDKRRFGISEVTFVRGMLIVAWVRCRRIRRNIF